MWPAASSAASSSDPSAYPIWLLWWTDWYEGGLLCAGALVAWALALYVATRGGLRRVPILTASALALLAIYLLGAGLATLTPEHPAWIGWLHRTWWAPAAVPAVWLLVALTLYDEEGPPAARSRPVSRAALPWVSAAVLATGVVFAILGTLTELVNAWSAAAEVPNQIPGDLPLRRVVPPGLLFVPYEVYLIVCVGGAAITFVRLWRVSAPGTPLRARFGWLAAAATLFLLAGAALTAAIGTLARTGLPGYLLLIAGIAIMGWNVARYGALLAGEVVTQDFWAFALSMTGLTALYGAVFVALGSTEHAWLRRSVPLLLLITATHVLADTRSPLIDRMLYGPVSGVLRWQLRALAGRVVRQPDLMTALSEVRETVDTLLRAIRTPAALPPPRPEPAAPPAVLPVPVTAGPPDAAPLAEFRLLVEGALRHLNDLPALSRHDLLDRLPGGAAGVGTGSPLERAGQLRADLAEAIGRLAPPGPRPSPGGQAGMGGWLHFLILHEAYVEGRPNKQVMQRYHLSEGTFHRARRRALDAITVDLHERWCGAAGHAV